MNTPANKKSHYINGIDGLRAIAVLSVFLFHLNNKLLPGGFCGVDIFFVISGYVVSTSLAREATAPFFKFITDFYARRIIRIYPALLMCILLIGVLKIFIVPSSWLSSSTEKTALYAFFGLSNFALIWFDDGYFSHRVEFNPFTHTWSLAVEEQFYLFFPIVFFIWLKWRSYKGVFGLFANWMLFALLVISLAYSSFETAIAADKAYYLLPSRFWELAFGAILFKLHQQNKCLPNSKPSAARILYCGIILIGLALLFSDAKSFPFPWAILSVCGALLVITGVANDIGKGLLVSKFFSNKAIAYIGRISYSLYLWHWPILVLFRWTVGLDKPQTVAGSILLIMIMSVISYHIFEQPIRQSSFIKLKPNWIIVATGLTTIVVSFVFTKWMFEDQSWRTLSVTKDTYNWYPYPSSYKPNQTYPMDGPLKGHRIFVLGDSHAGAYATMLRQLTYEQGVDVRLYSKGGCPVASLLRASTSNCSQYLDESFSQIKKIAEPGDIVFLASLRMDRLCDQWKVFNESELEKQQSNSVAQRAIALKEADSLISKLESTSLIVMIDAPKPVFKSPPFRCSDWFNNDNSICRSGFTISRNFLLKHRKTVMESLDILKHEHPKLFIWDPFPVLCYSETCAAFEKQLPLFFDGDHLSGYGNRVLYPSFFSMLKLIWKL